MKLKEEIEINEKKLSIETGVFAKQANGAVTIQMGDTFLLVTAVSSNEVKEETDFLPLMVDYVEKTYSAGKIPAGYFKREGKPTEYEILASRLIDRTIRPLFLKNYFKDVQIIALVLSADRENDPVVLAITGASASLMLSDIPFNGPVAGIRIGKVNEKFVANPSYEERKNSSLDLVLGVSKHGIIMIESESSFINEQEFISALNFGYEKAQIFLEIQERMFDTISPSKQVIEEKKLETEFENKIREFLLLRIPEAFLLRKKKERNLKKEAIFNEIMLTLLGEFKEKEAQIKNIFFEVERELMRKMILEENKRIDGRGINDLREVECRVGLLPRVHGSALFTKGETQAFVTVTLGTSEDEQKVDLLTGEEKKSFMLHYNFHPFCTGETRSLRAPSRREIGHAYLAERSLLPALPTKDDNFQYTVRVVSEILESNGSSSMATVCGSSLALMDAGMPFKCHVAGIAMGIVMEGEKYVILTDILGDEDHAGDMDFKIAGNEEGISAVQMDIKTEKISLNIFPEVFRKAKEARKFILEEMKKTISEPKREISPYAPRFYTININPDRIKDLIGPLGRHIKSIIEKTSATINIEENGKITIASANEENAQKAISMVKSFTEEAELGKIYIGKVVKVTDFGAYVRILPGVEGLLPVTELTDQRFRRVSDLLKEGDEVMVKVIQIDEKTGKIKLSRREAMGKPPSPSPRGRKTRYYDY